VETIFRLIGPRGRGGHRRGLLLRGGLGRVRGKAKSVNWRKVATSQGKQGAERHPSSGFALRGKRNWVSATEGKKDRSFLNIGKGKVALKGGGGPKGGRRREKRVGKIWVESTGLCKEKKNSERLSLGVVFGRKDVRGEKGKPGLSLGRLHPRGKRNENTASRIKSITEALGKGCSRRGGGFREGGKRLRY